MQGVELSETRRFGGMHEIRVNVTLIDTHTQVFSAGNCMLLFWKGKKSIQGPKQMAEHRPGRQKCVAALLSLAQNHVIKLKVVPGLIFTFSQNFLQMITQN